MGFIKIDSKLQKSDTIADFFSSLIMDERIKLPKLSLPQILIAKSRPGLNAAAISSSVISRFKEADIPTGALSEGVPNSMEEFVKIIMEELVDAIQNDMRVDIAVDQGMQVYSTGANAAGPVVSTGANIMAHTAVGVPV